MYDERAERLSDLRRLLREPGVSGVHPGGGPATAPSFARPKSTIFTCPRSVMKMFAVLMSRWTMPEAVRGVERV